MIFPAGNTKITSGADATCNLWGNTKETARWDVYQQDAKIVRPLEVSHQLAAIIIAAAHRVPMRKSNYQKYSTIIKIDLIWDTF